MNAVTTLIYSKNSWECPAWERSRHWHDPLHLSNRSHSHSSPSYSGTTVRRSRSFRRFAEDRHRTLVVGRFRHLHQFLVLLLRGHLHPAINKVRLEYNGWGWGWGDSYTLLLCEWPLESMRTFIKAFVFWIEVNVYSACTGYLLLRCDEVTPNNKSDIDNEILKLIY